MTAPPDDILDLLTAYALDALEPEEISRIHALLARHPELQATLAELRTTADTLPYGLPEADPAPQLRQRVLDYATGRDGRRPAAPASRPGRVRGWLLGLSGLAAAAVVVAAIGWGQVVSLRGELVAAQATAEAAQRVVASLQGGDSHGTIMRTPQGEMVLVVKLPALSPGRIYQLWRIQGGNEPASAGVFNVDQQGYGIFNLAQQPQLDETVAVTNEPAPGSEQPTSNPLIKGLVQNT
jgi:anti-sigma-K factor RskA